MVAVSLLYRDPGVGGQRSTWLKRGGMCHDSVVPRQSIVICSVMCFDDAMVQLVFEARERFLRRVVSVKSLEAVGIEEALALAPEVANIDDARQALQMAASDREFLLQTQRVQTDRNAE